MSMSRRAFARLGLLAASTALIAGCGALGAVGDAGSAPQLYDLVPPSRQLTAMPLAMPLQLVIAEPDASGGVEGNRITLKPSPVEVQYYAGARWVDRTPRLVQTLLIEDVEAMGLVASVERQSVGVRGDYMLKSDIRSFEAVYSGTPGDQNPPTITVAINFKLVRQRDGRIIGSRTFEARGPAAANRIESIVGAFDAQLGAVLGQEASWLRDLLDGEMASGAMKKP